jgi:hypothetical protein
MLNIVADMIMRRFQNRFCFHRAMNYLYTPIAFENFSKMNFTTRSRAKEENGVHWEFTKEHPCFETEDAVVYRSAKCVPAFRGSDSDKQILGVSSN